MTAPPGAGKTTVVPQLLAAQTGDKILVSQPRRVAARAAARRIASLRGEPVGKSVGFRVRGESKPGTEIEMITPGVLLRMLQSDPGLDGVSGVVVDEIHERHVQSDLATAFLVDIRNTLRDDLELVAMSATVNSGAWVGLLGADVLDIPGEQFPVATSEDFGPTPLGALASGAIVVKREFLDHVAAVIRRATAVPGSVLVFLPGVREIEEVAARLGGVGLPVQRLHGQVSAEEQARVLAEPDGDRIILATSLAESSLTVPGVHTVVDSGLAREPRFDARTGIGGLVTVAADRARMTQRAGRAGRLGPGRAIRCMSFARAPEHGEPEIRTSDLTDPMLQAACWGAPGMSGLALLDPPPTPARDAALSSLRQLGAVDDDGRATELGRRLAALPTEPHLGRALLAGAGIVGADRSAEVVALLGSDARIDGADLARGLRNLGPARLEAKRLAKLAKDALADQRSAGAPRSAQSPGAGASGAGGSGSAAINRPMTLDDQLATVVALARPEWIARARGKAYLLANGTGAALPQGSPLTGQEWLAVAELDRGQGRSDALIRSAVPIAKEDAIAAGRVDETVRIDVVGGKVRARKVTSLGAIELDSQPVKATREMIREARLAEVRSQGVAALHFSETQRELRERLAFLHGALGDPWPDVDDDALAARLPEWYDPDSGAISMRNLLPWPEATRFDELAPERIEAPLGSAKVDYSSGRPIARLRVQECFGWAETPKLAGVPVTLELLSPARRPLAVTDDLASFWAGPYAQVRAEMRGRYPKHPWPENPLEAQATSRTKNADRRR